MEILFYAVFGCSILGLLAMVLFGALAPFILPQRGDAATETRRAENRFNIEDLRDPAFVEKQRKAYIRLSRNRWKSTSSEFMERIKSAEETVSEKLKDLASDSYRLALVKRETYLLEKEIERERKQLGKELDLLAGMPEVERMEVKSCCEAHFSLLFEVAQLGIPWEGMEYVFRASVALKLRSPYSPEVLIHSSPPVHPYVNPGTHELIMREDLSASLGKLMALGQYHNALRLVISVLTTQEPEIPSKSPEELGMPVKKEAIA